MKGVHEPKDRSNHTYGESHSQSYCDRMFWLPRDQAAYVARNGIPESAIHCAE